MVGYALANIIEESGTLQTGACMESLKIFVTVTWLKFQIPIGGEKVLAGKPWWQSHVLQRLENGVQILVPSCHAERNLPHHSNTTWQSTKLSVQPLYMCGLVSPCFFLDHLDERRCLYRWIDNFMPEWWFRIVSRNILRLFFSLMYLILYVWDICQHNCRNTGGKMLETEVPEKHFQTLHTNARFSNSPSVIVPALKKPT